MTDNKKYVQTLQKRLAEVEKQNADMREELRIANIIFNSQEGMLLTDENSVVIRVNNAFTKLTGYSAEETIGQTPQIFETQLHEESFYQNIRDTLKKSGFWQGDIWDRCKDGTLYVERLNISIIKSTGGVLSHYVASFTDITNEKKAADEIHQLAYYDPLTELPNRRLFQQKLEELLALTDTSKMTGALLFIDLDHFKVLNDTLGHDIGDLLLTQVAARLLSCIRKDDIVARMGGDEFVVILESLCLDIDKSALLAQQIGEKIISRLNKDYQLNHHSYHCTPSVGITLFNAKNKSVENLLKQADIAMYASKAAGRNNLQFFNPEMQAKLISSTNMLFDLQVAIEKKQFTLYYQLQTTYNKQAIGAEVLIRWQHPTLGLVSPTEFIPAAEQSRLILPIGQWVLENACAQLKRWADNPETQHLCLAVNISAHQFHQNTFTEELCVLLDKYFISGNRLKLELTESLLLNKVKKTITKMHTLKKRGVSFSMDDFGTGYSSLAYLTQLPFDQLKIDQSFIQNIGVNPADALIIQTIIGMANNLNLDIVAEGVETEEQRAFLEEHGCPNIQGYLLGRPMPVEQFELTLNVS